MRSRLVTFLGAVWICCAVIAACVLASKIALGDSAQCYPLENLIRIDVANHPNIRLMYGLTGLPAQNLMFLMAKYEELPRADRAVILSDGKSEQVKIMLLRGSCVVFAKFMPRDTAVKLAGQPT